jgi:hypothetical protein
MNILEARTLKEQAEDKIKEILNQLCKETDGKIYTVNVTDNIGAFTTRTYQIVSVEIVLKV